MSLILMSVCWVMYLVFLYQSACFILVNNEDYKIILIKLCEHEGFENKLCPV